MKKFRRVYEGRMVLRNGKRASVDGKSYSNREKALDAVREHKKRYSLPYSLVNGMGLVIERCPKESDWDIVGYEIRSREVSEWEVETVD